MGAVDHKQELFENVLRLRRAGRVAPDSRDISAVRASLEEELGEAVPRRFAARILGVSHTALERWVQTGDVPIVYSPNGRMQVPVPALLDLRERVDADRADGAGRYVLTAAMKRQRDAAKRLRPHGSGEVSEGHDRARARSIAYHRALADRLRRPMVDEARHVLYRWRRQGRIDDRYAREWEEILQMPVREIRRAIVAEGPHADDLRQNSPLAGLLSEPERRKILSEVR